MAASNEARFAGLIFLCIMLIQGVHKERFAKLCVEYLFLSLQVFENIQNKLSEKKVGPDTIEIADSNVISAEGGEQAAKSIYETKEVSKTSEEESRETEDSVTKESEQKVTGSVVFESKLNPSVPKSKLSAPVFQLSAKATAFKPSSESYTPKETCSPAEIRLASYSLFMMD